MLSKKILDLYEDELGSLAMDFRRNNRDKEKQKEIVENYHQVLKQMINGGMKLVPSPEDQLPDDLMPQEFFEWAKREAEADSPPTCSLCGGTGKVKVAHWPTVRCPSCHPFKITLHDDWKGWMIFGVGIIYFFWLCLLTWG